MNRILARMRDCAVAIMCIAFMSFAISAMAQDAKPSETVGVSVDSTRLLTIAPQIPGFEGYVLRLRQVTMEPGAVLAHHSHANRPTIVYIMSGEMTEYLDDGYEITHGAGDRWVEGVDVVHWAENRGDIPAVLITSDIVPEQ